MVKEKKQELKWEGFSDAKSYITAFKFLNTMKNYMGSLYEGINDQKIEILELVLRNAMLCLENSTKRINEIESKYKEYLKESYNRPFSNYDFEETLKDFAESHKKLAEYVAYSKLEAEVSI